MVDYNFYLMPDNDIKNYTPSMAYNNVYIIGEVHKLDEKVKQTYKLSISPYQFKSITLFPLLSIFINFNRVLKYLVDRANDLGFCTGTEVGFHKGTNS